MIFGMENKWWLPVGEIFFFRTGEQRGLVRQVGGWVVRGDGLGTEGDEVGVVGGGDCVDGLGGEGLLAECFGFAALRGVEDEDAVGEGGDADVVPERTSRSVQRLAFRGRCPARVLRYSQGYAASRGRSARLRLCREGENCKTLFI